MTAIEWLMEQITYDNGFGERRNSYTDSFDLTEFFEEAKEIEKQQLEKTFKDSFVYGLDWNQKEISFYEYYNETFKNK
jgi:hypothetical protein